MKNYSLNYGDNAECDVCYSVFDTRNSQYEIVSDNWVCDRCLDRDNEELAEMLGVETSIVSEARA